MLFFALLLCLWTSSRASIEPIDPSSRRFAILYKWADRHRQYVEQAKAQHSVAFYGDSITYKLSEDKSWNKTYAPMGAANYGLRADRTEHLLWRIQNGELDGPPATVLVLLIGTNNLINTKDAEIVAGIRLIVAELRLRCPSSRILLLGLFAREASANHPFRQRIQHINTAAISR